MNIKPLADRVLILPAPAEEKTIGGIIIRKETGGVDTWRYCRNRINNTKDLTGWDFFNLNAPVNI